MKIWTFISLVLGLCLDLSALDVGFVQPGEAAGADAVAAWADTYGQPAAAVDGGDVKASLFVRQSMQGLHVRVAVEDREHNNSYSGVNLWRGDCIYIAFDGLADSLTGGTLDDNDGLVLLGLGAGGAEARVLGHGRTLYNQTDLSRECYQITRSADACTYDLLLTWNMLGTAPGFSDTLGLSVYVAHKNAAGEEISWGNHGTSPNAKSLKRLSLAAPDKAFLSVTPGILQVAGPRQKSVFRITRAAGKPAVLTVEIGDQTRTLELPGDGRVASVPCVIGDEDLQNTNRLHLVIREDSTVLFDESYDLVNIYANHREILAGIRRSNPVSPAAKMHLRSLQCLAEDIINRSFLITDVDWYRKVLHWQREILESLPESGFDFKEHLAAGMPMLMAFTSDADGSLQFATFQLPPDYDGTKTYPLVVYLHGSGPKTPVDTLVYAADNNHEDTLFAVGENNQNDSGQRQCILLAPYGRGSVSYESLAEMDVWKSIRLIEEQFSIDADRRYLTGFSMGGHGTWQLASHRPDLWAAINVAAGFYPTASMWDRSLRENLRGVPAIFWCGDQDGRMLKGLERFQVELNAAGMPPAQVTLANGLGHVYPYANYSDMLKQCYGYKRGGPSDAFSYATHDYRYAGRSGIRMLFDYSEPPETFSASFSCRVEKETLILFSRNAAGMLIEPQRIGFAPEQTLRILWNDREVYSGPAIPLINIGQPRDRHFQDPTAGLY